MTLYQKTFLIIAVTLAGLMAFLYGISRVILLNSYIELEEQNTRQAVEQALNALSDDITRHDTMSFLKLHRACLLYPTRRARQS